MLVNRFINLRWLRQRLFWILHGWQNLVNFIVAFFMDYFILYYVVAFSHFFSEVIWSKIDKSAWFFKISFNLGYNFKMSQSFLIIWANGNRVLLNVITRVRRISLSFVFRLSCSGVGIAFFLRFSTKYGSNSVLWIAVLIYHSIYSIRYYLNRFLLVWIFVNKVGFL